MSRAILDGFFTQILSLIEKRVRAGDALYMVSFLSLGFTCGIFVVAFKWLKMCQISLSQLVQLLCGLTALNLKENKNQLLLSIGLLPQNNLNVLRFTCVLMVDFSWVCFFELVISGELNLGLLFLINKLFSHRLSDQALGIFNLQLRNMLRDL